MEFWGIEVKCGETFKYSLEDDMILHLSQACLGEIKKDKANEPVYLYVSVQGKKLVLGTLITEKLPQQQFDLVFDKDFELSHNLKSGSVYFYGYLANNPVEDEMTEDDSDDSDEDIPLLVPNGPPLPKAKEEKPVEATKPSAAKGKESAAGKQKVKIVEPKKDDDEDSSDEDAMSDGDEDESEGEGDSDDSEDGSSDSDEESPKKAEPSKKRPAESATKTPIQDKKAKVTPQKTDGKKVSGHVATPHPAKQAGKTPATNKPNQKSPKSGAHSCKSCDKSFASDKALESHSKAKHSAAK